MDSDSTPSVVWGQVGVRVNVRTPLRFSLLIGGGILVICLIDLMLRPPDTLNGDVVAGDGILRLAVAIFVATMGLVGSFLALRISKVRYLSIPRTLTVVVLYAICMYLPEVFSKTVTVEIVKPGHLHSDGGLWWSLAEPLVVPFLLTLVLTHFSFGRPGREK